MKPLALVMIVLASVPALAQKPVSKATCRGGSCRACTNCRYCAHCKKGGGTCSVCTKAMARIVKAERAKKVAKR